MSYEALAVVLPVVSAVLVALFNNWEKINPAKKKINDILDITKETKESTEKNRQEIEELDKAMKADVTEISEQIKSIKESQKTELQTQILNKCKEITTELNNGDYENDPVDFTEDMKQLIILYREYYNAGFNHHGQIYFDNTFKKAEALYPNITTDLMQTLFSDYKPGIAKSE